MVIRILLFWLATFAVQAAEVAGVKLEDKANVAGTELVLKGAGLRKRAFFQVYAMGLYVADRKGDPIAQGGIEHAHVPGEFPVVPARGIPVEEPECHGKGRLQVPARSREHLLKLGVRPGGVPEALCLGRLGGPQVGAGGRRSCRALNRPLGSASELPWGLLQERCDGQRVFLRCGFESQYG